MTRKKLIAGAALVAVALFATAVNVAAGEESKRVRGFGKVASIEGNTFMMQTRRHGTVKVQHDAKTEWHGGSASDLKVGSIVGVAGVLSNDLIHAEKIGFMKEGRRPRRKPHLIRGEISAVGDHQFTLKTRRGDITVKWNDETKFRNGGAEDIDAGARVGVAGRPQSEGIAGVDSGVRPVDRKAAAARRVLTGERVLVAQGIVFPKTSAESKG